jgi:glycosyltransferase involved in cell wall biosynthesis
LRVPRREELDGMLVLRCWQFREGKRNFLVRALNMILYMFAIVRHMVLRRRAARYDVAVVSTMPPVLMAAATRVGSRMTGTSVIYHMMDIYPELAVISGMIREGLLTKWLRAVDRKNCSRAARVVVLSEDMRDTVAGRGTPIGNVEILNNFQLESFAGEGVVPEGLEKPAGSFRLMFAGNIGRFQGLETLIEAIALLDDLPDLRLDILGDGIARQALERQAADRLGRRVFFHGYQPIENATCVIATADLSLITLNPEVIRMAYPSKTMTYLGVGSPVLVVVEQESSLARMVEAEGIGYFSPQGDAAALADAIRCAYRRREELAAMRLRARELAEREFTASAVVPRWIRLFAEIADERATARAGGSCA